jgi:hypothetical protein
MKGSNVIPELAAEELLAFLIMTERSPLLQALEFLSYPISDRAAFFIITRYGSAMCKTHFEIQAMHTVRPMLKLISDSTTKSVFAIRSDREGLMIRLFTGSPIRATLELQLIGSQLTVLKLDRTLAFKQCWLPGTTHLLLFTVLITFTKTYYCTD